MESSPISVIPVYTSLSEIYPDPKHQLARYQSLITLYEQLYNFKPQYVVRAQGRVNLAH